MQQNVRGLFRKEEEEEFSAISESIQETIRWNSQSTLGSPIGAKPRPYGGGRYCETCLACKSPASPQSLPKLRFFWVVAPSKDRLPMFDKQKRWWLSSYRYATEDAVAVDLPSWFPASAVEFYVGRRVLTCVEEDSKVVAPKLVVDVEKGWPVVAAVGDAKELNLDRAFFPHRKTTGGTAGAPELWSYAGMPCCARRFDDARFRVDDKGWLTCDAYELVYRLPGMRNWPIRSAAGHVSKDSHSCRLTLA